MSLLQYWNRKTGRQRGGNPTRSRLHSAFKGSNKQFLRYYKRCLTWTAPPRPHQSARRTQTCAQKRGSFGSQCNSSRLVRKGIRRQQRDSIAVLLLLPILENSATTISLSTNMDSSNCSSVFTRADPMNEAMTLEQKRLDRNKKRREKYKRDSKLALSYNPNRIRHGTHRPQADTLLAYRRKEDGGNVRAGTDGAL